MSLSKRVSNGQNCILLDHQCCLTYCPILLLSCISHHRNSHFYTNKYYDILEDSFNCDVIYILKV